MTITLERTGAVPFYKLDTQQDLLLFLIHKELHEAKIKLELDRIGFMHDSLFIYDLGDLIISLAQIKGRDDELWEWYQNLIDDTAEKLIIGNKELSFKLVTEVYQELVEYQKDQS